MRLLPLAMHLSAAASGKPPWLYSKCFWNAPSEECLFYFGFYPKSSLTPTSKCGKTTIDASSCTSQTDNDGRPCFWSSADDTCYPNTCKNFDKAKCDSNAGEPLSCRLSSDETCEDLKCQNNADYNSEVACVADANSIGPCKWVTYSSSCQDTSCTDSKNETSCMVATKTVKPMEFMFGSAPYGKTPCHWTGSSCLQIYQCSSYGSPEECDKDAAGFGKCQWNWLKQSCQDMLLCNTYEDESNCVADSYKAASTKDPRAQCWWQVGPNAFTVGPPIALTGIFKSSGPVATSQNLEINKDRTLKVLDGGYLGIALGMGMLAIAERQVLQVTDETGTAKPWVEMPKPLPDGYSIHLNGVCDDNLDFSLTDFANGECDKDTEAKCTPSKGDSRSTPPSVSSSAVNLAQSLFPAVAPGMLWLALIW